MGCFSIRRACLEARRSPPDSGLTISRRRLSAAVASCRDERIHHTFTPTRCVSFECARCGQLPQAVDVYTVQALLHSVHLGEAALHPFCPRAAFLLTLLH